MRADRTPPTPEQDEAGRKAIDKLRAAPGGPPMDEHEVFDEIQW